MGYSNYMNPKDILGEMRPAALSVTNDKDRTVLLEKDQRKVSCAPQLLCTFEIVDEKEWSWSLRKPN